MKKRMTGLLMAALLIFSLAGCGAGKQQGANNEEHKETIQIGTKKGTEQNILGEMLALLIEEKTNYKTKVTKDLGAIGVVHEAMKKGNIHLYPEYTSTGWVNILKKEAGSADDDTLFETLQKEYSEQFGMTWIGLYGFNNTYTMAVRKETADQYNIKTTSDMAAVSDKLVFGANGDYIERTDGYPKVRDTYNLKFKDIKEIDLTLRWQIIEKKEVDVINGYTTDAQLGTDKYVALEDDKNVQVNYFCSTVVREDILENYEGLREVLEMMDGKISDSEMANMNYQVEVEKKEDVEVAREFLISKGLIEE